MNDSISFSEITQKLSDARVYIMGIAMLMVVLYHYGFFPFAFLGHWGVDAFLFVSGFGIYFSLKKTKSISFFYWRRFVRIVPGAVLCGMCFTLMGNPLGAAALAPFGLNLWYIRTILIFYAISPLLYHSIRRWKCFACIFLIVLSAFAAGVSPFAWLLKNELVAQTLSWSLARLPLFVAGMSLPYIAEQMDLRIPRWTLLCIALIGLILMCMCRFYQLSYHSDFAGSLYFLLIPVIVYGVICVDCCLRYLPRFFLQILHFFGLFSLEIYLVHEHVLKEVPFIKTYVFSSTLAVVVSIVISLLLAWLVNLLCRPLQLWALQVWSAKEKMSE